MDRGSSPLSFRHVVFPGLDDGHGRAANLAPPRAPPGQEDRGGGGGASDPPPLTKTTALTPEDESFAGWVLGRAGLDAGCYKPETLGRRLPACLRALKAAGVAEARALLDRDPQRLPAALDALVIGVSHFFRDPPVFAALGSAVLPEMIGAAADDGRPLRVWSAGCSGGQELYSIALLLAEVGVLGAADLLGTDCRAVAVDRAATGRFDRESLRNVPPGLLAQYFEPDAPGPDCWRVGPHVGGAVRWRAADLLDQAEAGPWDLILCRNVTIYLRPEPAARVWDRLTAALRPGGVLVTGKGERPAGCGDRLTPVGPCLYRRRTAAAPAARPWANDANQANEAVQR